MKLVFIHGIAQANTSPQALLDEWSTDLRQSGVSEALLAAADPVVAYYGDILSAGKGKINLRAMAMNDPERLQFISAVANDMVNAAQKISVSSLIAGRLLSQSSSFTKITRNLLTPKARIGADDPISILDEIYDYLTKETLRNAIDARVAEALGDQPMTIVAHSLGAVVAYRLLRDRRLRCRRLVTLGAPLSIALVRNRLTGDFTYPENLQDWHNCYDAFDVVCLGKAFPAPADWKPRLRHIKVSNLEPFGHDADGYLRTPEVVQSVQQALAG